MRRRRVRRRLDRVQFATRAGVVSITGADAVAVSYPRFFDELQRIARGS